MSVKPPFPSSQQGVIRSSQLLPIIASCEESHASDWLAYHQANPGVYAEFCAFAEKMRVETKRTIYSVEIIINVLRWHRDLKSEDGDFKINNNFKSFYARMYEWHYACKGFFRKRKSYADDVEFPDAHYGILRGRLPEAS